MTRLGLLLMSLVIGAGLAVGGAFAIGATLNSSQQTPVTQTIYNYGTP